MSDPVLTLKLDGPVADAPARRPPQPEPDPVNAPLGWMFDRTIGNWRAKKRRGRQSDTDTGDKARVRSGAGTRSPRGVRKPSTPVDYRSTVREMVEGLWFVLGATPVPDKVFGYDMADTRVKLRVQAYLFQQNQTALATGLNTLAKHNSFVEARLAALKSGESGLWILPVAMMLIPFVAASTQLWSTGNLAELTAIADKVESETQEYLTAMMTQASTEATNMMDDQRSPE